MSKRNEPKTQLIKPKISDQTVKTKNKQPKNQTNQRKTKTKTNSRRKKKEENRNKTTKTDKWINRERRNEGKKGRKEEMNERIK